MKKLSVLLFSFLGVFLILASLVEADTEFKREVNIDLVNPVENSDANAKLYLSLTELSGKGLDVLNKKFSLDNYLAGRIGQIFADMYATGFLGYYSHEFAHTREWLRYGKYGWKVDWADWSLLVPHFRSSVYYIPTNNQKLRLVAAGLNQEEEDASLVNQKTLRKLPFDQGISFLFRKFSTATYDIYSSSAGLDVDNLGDIGLYSLELKKAGINLGSGDIKAQAAIASLLSFKSWDSLAAIYQYLANGRRVSNSTLLDLYGNKVSPPIFQYIMTPRGGYYNLTSTLISGSGTTTEFSFGTDLDFLWPGKVDNLRFGAKVNNLFSIGPIEFSPFGYLNVKRTELSYLGYLAGIEAEWKITKEFSFTGKVSSSDNDLVEDTKGNSNGLMGVVGLRYYLF